VFRNRTSSTAKLLSLTCGVLLACGIAGAQKKKKQDPNLGMPPLPAPKLLVPATAVTAQPATELTASSTQPAVNPAAAIVLAAPDGGADTPSTAAAAPAAPTEVAVNPAAALLTAAATPAPAAPAPASSVNAPVSTYAPSTGRTHSILSFDEYQHLLNLVLPLDHRSPPGLEYSLILRFEPHIHPESEIVIRHWRNGATETAVYRVDKVNAWRAAYGNVTDGQTPDFEAMTKQITIVRNSFNVQPSDATAWRRQLLPTLQKELAKARKKVKHPGHNDEHEMLGNGTRYELWYIQGDEEMHFVSLDSEVDTVTKGNENLPKLMNDVRSYADSHLTTYKPLQYSADEIQPPRKLLAKNKKNKNDKNDWQ